MTRSKKKTMEPDIRQSITTTDDGSFMVMIANMNGDPSKPYHYSTVTGKIEESHYPFPMEWIGSIQISPNLFHRVWIPVKNIFTNMNIPMELKELERFVLERDGKPFYRVKDVVGKENWLHLFTKFTCLCKKCADLS